LWTSTMRAWGSRKDVPMSATRRRFTTAYKVEAAHRVIDSDRSVAEVARELKH
jgi:transposase-like protein